LSAKSTRSDAVPVVLEHVVVVDHLVAQAAGSDE
jgi:hypothetical protein